MAIRTAVEHWRRLKPWCMGALFWQLNDLWPVASWSSIDYHGRWKVLQHEAARFFAPLLVSLVREENTLSVWATSDLEERLALTGELDVVTWAGKTVARVPLAGRLAAGQSRRIARLSLETLLDGAEPHQVGCFVRIAGGSHRAENHATLVPWKWVTLPKPKIHANLRAAPGGVVLVVTTNVVTPFFHAELHGLEGHFAGDWQVLRPGRTYTFPWVPHLEHGAREPGLREARALLRVTSLYDFYMRDGGGHLAS
jgi:beta-mannosidase